MASSEGIGAFYSGLLQRSCYMGPLWAIQFAVNGWMSEQLLDLRSKREEKEA
jgi:hypothetical protein|tara:strand:+ start:1148 stop:1303 length:156 start_codon:yes stop_codon:yes gene_type:complete